MNNAYRDNEKPKVHYHFVPRYKDELKLFGKNLFDLFDYATSNIMLPLNSAIACLVAGWFVVPKQDNLFQYKILHKIILFMMRFVLPIILISLIFIGN